MAKLVIEIKELGKLIELIEDEYLCPRDVFGHGPGLHWIEGYNKFKCEDQDGNVCEAKPESDCKKCITDFVEKHIIESGDK